MDTVRYFKELSKTQARKAGLVASAHPSLQQVQHHVAVDAGFRSWGDLLAATEASRCLAVVLNQEPHLNRFGFGAGAFNRRSLAERRADVAQWRSELRENAEAVEQVREWLVEHIEPRKSINTDLGSYTLKHLAENSLGFYVANGELIAAAIIAGFGYRREDGTSPNATFAMSSRSVNAIRRLQR